MGIINITNIYDEQRTAKNTGKPYMVRVVEGTKVGSDEAWVQPIFMNNKQLVDKLNQFAKGEVANFVYEKTTRGGREFFDLVDIQEPSDVLLAKAESAPKVGGGGKKKSSNGSSTLSKEEWAEKDRAKNMGIAKAVALKLANDNTKMGTAPEDLIAMANEFLPYLLDTEPLSEDTPLPWDDDDDDPLAPPVED